MQKMGKEEKDEGKIEAVLQILRRQEPLTVKQEKFCNNACVERFLKAKGENAKKAGKHLRACLSWRESIGIEHLMADEFTTEIAEGVAYVAGHDAEARPVMVFRVKQDYQKLHTQKMYIRLLVFTLEVAIATMSRSVEQFVALFDASFFRSASAFLNLLLPSLRIISDYYPGRLHKAFVIDPPTHFSFLWKAARPFMDSSATAAASVISSMDYEDLLDDTFAGYPRTCSLRYTSTATATPTGKRVGASSSSRFSFTVSGQFDSLKPWYLSRIDATIPEQSEAYSFSTPALVSPLNARSYSFASPAARSYSFASPAARSSRPSPATPTTTRTPRPSFLQSPAAFFRKEGGAGHGMGRRNAFLPYLRFYRRPYDEMVYRSKMRPPLGGLISIVSPSVKRRNHCTFSSHRF